MANGETTKIIFQPSVRRGEDMKGAVTIIEASRPLEVDIEALCGENSVCGEYNVRIEEGFFREAWCPPLHRPCEWEVEEKKFIVSEVDLVPR